MATKPKTLCRACRRNTTRDGLCEACKAKGEGRKDQKTRSSARLGYNYRWQKARLIHLRNEPLCRECLKENKATPATVVDHIVPHKGNAELFWDSEGNWQSLCFHHHQVKVGMGL